MSGISTTKAPERFILSVNQHWISYVLPVLASLVVAAAGFILYTIAGYTALHETWSSHLLLLCGMALLLLSVHFFFHKILSKIADISIVTTERVIDMRVNLLMEETMLEMHLSQVKSIHAKKRSVIQAILNYGDLELYPAGTVECIPHPQRVAKAIEEAMGRA